MDLINTLAAKMADEGGVYKVQGLNVDRPADNM